MTQTGLGLTQLWWGPKILMDVSYMETFHMHLAPFCSYTMHLSIKAKSRDSKVKYIYIKVSFEIQPESIDFLLNLK